MKGKRRFLASVISVAMIWGCLAVPAWADENSSHDFSVTYRYADENMTDVSPLSTVTPDAGKVRTGDTVTLTVNLASNEKLTEEPSYLGKTLTNGFWVNSAGQTIPIEKSGDSYSFVMPDADVYILAVFDYCDYSVTVEEPIHFSSSDVYKLYGNQMTEVTAADEGDEINIRLAASSDSPYIVTDMTYTYTENGEEKTQTIPFTNDFNQIFIGRFTMPASDVTIKITDVAAHFIAYGDNAYVALTQRMWSQVTGETVNLIPYDDYLLSSVTVTCGETNIDVTENADGTYSFVMPDGDVAVNVEYREVSNLVTYLSRTWDPDQKKVVTSTEVCPTDPIRLTSSIRMPDSGWYYVNESVYYSSLDYMIIGSDKTVNIILGDDARIDCGSIYVEPAGTLNIYGKSSDKGQIIAGGKGGCAGIGCPNESCFGNINIYGGTIKATGDAYCAGIGTGKEPGDRESGYIKIFGGSVTAKGGVDGAGIGGGKSSKGPRLIEIYGGTVNATGGALGAGIGGGNDYGANTINIYGGDVTAQGGGGAAGIGTGEQIEGEVMGSITISGGNVTATGGDHAAGIGGGYGGSLSADDIESGSITISGGTVVANAGGGAAGIGSGASSDYGGTITISGGNVSATSHNDNSSWGGAGIGSGTRADFTGMIRISGGTVTATGAGNRIVTNSGSANPSVSYSGGAGIGSGCFGDGASTSSITISGGTVYATGHGGGAAIGAGVENSGIGDGGGEMEGSISLSGGELHLQVVDGGGETPYVGQRSNGSAGPISWSDRFEVHFDGQYPVAAGQRESTIKSKSGTGTLIVAVCSHDGMYSIKNSEQHHVECIYCGAVYDENHNMELGQCTLCEYKEEYEKPQFIGYAMQLDGKITLQYFVGFPDNMTPNSYTECYVTFEGKNVNSSKHYPLSTEKSPKANGYVVELNISSIEMAEQYTPTLHYTYAQGGNESTEVGNPYSAKEYIDYGMAHFSGDDLDIIKALADYGFYSQQYLSVQNHWTIGTDYAAMTTKSSSSFDYAAIKTAAKAWEVERSTSDDVTAVTYSIRFGSEISLAVFLTPKDGVTIDKVIVDGEEVTPKPYGNQYYVIFSNISVTRLTEAHTIRYGEAYINVSPMSYVYGILKDRTSSNEAKNIVCALYNLAKACE